MATCRSCAVRAQGEPEDSRPQLLLTDTGSRFGTFLNNQKCAPDDTKLVKHGDKIKFGTGSSELT